MSAKGNDKIRLFFCSNSSLCVCVCVGVGVGVGVGVCGGERE